jgi:hypothetical protein
MMEAFVYVVVVLINHELYAELADLLAATYWLEHPYEPEEPMRFDAFSAFIRSIDEFRKLVFVAAGAVLWRNRARYQRF